MRHFEQALRVDRPPSAFSSATLSCLPATQGQRSKVASSLMCAGKAALRCRSQTATAGGKLIKHMLEDHPDLLAASNKKAQAGEIREPYRYPKI